MLDYSDILYMHANQSSLKMLDSVYHASLRFVTKSSFRTHHCSLYESVGWLSLHNRRLEHWYIFLFKAILYKLPSYLCSLLTLKVTTSKCNLRSYGQIMYDIPQTITVVGESAFKVFAPLSWYKLQNHLKLDYLPTMTQFKIRIKDWVLNAHVLLLSIADNYVEMMLNCQLSFFVKCCCVVLVTVHVF